MCIGILRFGVTRFRRKTFRLLILAGAGIVGSFAWANAADPDPLRGFASIGLQCPSTETGIAQAVMTNSEGDLRVVRNTYQYGIPTLVALFSQIPSQKETFIVALDPKTDPNPLGRRLSALTRGCFKQEDRAAGQQSVDDAIAVRMKKPPRPAVHRYPPEDNYRNFEDRFGGCSDFLCALFGNHGR